MTVSIITPWLNASELIAQYEQSTAGAEIVIIDNGSDWIHANRLYQMSRRVNGQYIRNNHNAQFSAANNQGLARASGDIIVFMNNDVECKPGFVAQVERDVTDVGALYGPSLLTKHGWQYIEGWCIAARREMWNTLDWDDQYYSGLYWEDNDLCARAVNRGHKLIKTFWPVWHYNNYTSSKIPGAYDKSAENERKFLERVRAWAIN